jgi:hypothetical protein
VSDEVRYHILNTKSSTPSILPVAARNTDMGEICPELLHCAFGKAKVFCECAYGDQFHNQIILSGVLFYLNCFI